MNKNKGFTLLELLVALIILSVGLLGLAALQIRANAAEMESYQRSQALLLANDIASRIRANSSVLPCYALTTNSAAGTPFAGTDNNNAFSCTGWGVDETRTIADNDLTQWQNQLLGTGETFTNDDNVTSNSGAMVGARGCLYYDATSRTVEVVVTWQGLTQRTDLDDDTNGTPDCEEGLGAVNCSCANSAYQDIGGNDYKRWLNIPVVIADLTNT